MDRLLNFLSEHKISYARRDHEAVFTVEQAAKVLHGLPGAATKNLFLRDDKGRRHFLVVTRDEKKVDMKALEQVIGSKGLGFASADRLRRYLGVEPGSVTLLALVNDSAHNVEVFIDRDVWAWDEVQCHPLVNTATLVIQRNELERFVSITGHRYTLIDVPH